MQVNNRAAFYIQPPLPLLLPLLQPLMLLHPFATFITLAHFPSHAPPYCAALLRISVISCAPALVHDVDPKDGSTALHAAGKRRPLAARRHSAEFDQYAFLCLCVR